MPKRLVSAWRRLPHPLRWLAVGIVGGTLVVLGLVFMVLPGPGIPLLVLGLVILASEFAWAEVVLHHVRRHAAAAANRARAAAKRRRVRS